MDRREAAKQLFEQHADEIYRFARVSLGSAAEADDLVQEVFVRVLRSWDDFRHDATPRTWLFALTRHAMQEMIRSRARHPKTTSFSDADLPVQPDPAPVPELEELLAVLSLPERQVVALRIVEDLPSREVARLLGCTDVRVRVTLHRALARLRVSTAGKGGIRRAPQ